MITGLLVQQVSNPAHSERCLVHLRSRTALTLTDGEIIEWAEKAGMKVFVLSELPTDAETFNACKAGYSRAVTDLRTALESLCESAEYIQRNHLGQITGTLKLAKDIKRARDLLKEIPDGS